MLRAMFNGQLLPPAECGAPVWALNDRGVAYGDGLFETMRLIAGKVRFLADHWQRLGDGCTRLGFPVPSIQQLNTELATLCAEQPDGVIKLLLTRGSGERGYRPMSAPLCTRSWQLFAAPPPHSGGLTIRYCATRLARHPQLAGIKHCNRLEQVLAQQEWCDTHIAEGLMLDTEGELIGGTMSNVFLVIEGTLVTPDLRYAGIAGVMRRNVLLLAQSLGIVCEQRAVHPEELQDATEVFLTNAVRGIQPVWQLAAKQWHTGSLTRQLMTAVEAC